MRECARAKTYALLMAVCRRRAPTTMFFFFTFYFSCPRLCAMILNHHHRCGNRRRSMPRRASNCPNHHVSPGVREGQARTYHALWGRPEESASSTNKGKTGSTQAARRAKTARAETPPASEWGTGKKNWLKCHHHWEAGACSTQRGVPAARRVQTKTASCAKFSGGGVLGSGVGTVGIR